jgi:hypothetical protein
LMVVAKNSRATIVQRYLPTGESGTPKGDGDII